MAVFARADSRFYWMWLEGTDPPVRVSTKIPIGTGAAKKSSKADADAIYQAAMGDLARGAFKFPTAKPARTFRQHAEHYRETVSAQHRGVSRERSLITSLLNAFGDTPLAQLTTQQIDDWKHARAQTKKHSTVNRELDVLKALLRSAVPLYLEVNPATAVKRFPLRRPPVTILSETAEAALLDVASPAERAFVLLGLDALLRAGDARRLKTDHDHGSYLVLVDSKVDTYKVPVSARLRAALDALEPKDGYYFPRRYGEKWAPMNRVTAFYLFQALCVRAGVPTGRKVGGITYHGLRHTGATRAARVVKLTVVQRLGGWKSLKQLERYDHPEDPEMIRAVEAIGSRPAHGKIQKQKNPSKKARVS